MDLTRESEFPADLSPLAWVQEELRRTLESVHKALRRVLRDGAFERVWVQPAAGDAGGALGLAHLAVEAVGEERGDGDERAPKGERAKVKAVEPPTDAAPAASAASATRSSSARILRNSSMSSAR